MLEPMLRVGLVGAFLVGSIHCHTYVACAQRARDDLTPRHSSSNFRMCRQRSNVRTRAIHRTPTSPGRTRSLSQRSRDGRESAATPRFASAEFLTAYHLVSKARPR